MPDAEVDKPITEPENSGVEMEQEASTEGYPLVQQLGSMGISRLPLTEALQTIMTSGIRGQSGMMLLVALVNKLETEASNLQRQNANATKTADDWKDKYYKKRELTSILLEPLKTQRKLGTFRQIMITLGALVLGISTLILLWIFLYGRVGFCAVLSRSVIKTSATRGKVGHLKSKAT